VRLYFQTMYWSTIPIKPSVMEGRPVISLWLTKRFLACSCAHEQPVRNDFFPSPRSCSGASVSLHPRRRRSNNTVVLVDRPAAALPLRASSRRRFTIDCPRARCFAIDCSHAAVQIQGLCLRRHGRSRVSAAYTISLGYPCVISQLSVSFKPPLLRKLTIRV
jgi:hypothetical protein